MKIYYTRFVSCVIAAGFSIWAAGLLAAAQTAAGLNLQLFAGLTVTGGFWALPQAVQTEGAPLLTITKGAPGFANISWTPASTNWLLQERVSLAAGSWTNSPTGFTNPIVVPAELPTKFYRLHTP